ncbi:unnamed protein product [Allacma fusca]|uniref:Serine-threonine/tyrosine-protein kinase catalytic domain-containing protein n=1 Tax=Allacma fusca TaxID=39272 RepID=A0A8J2LCX0_9HEXA|nr:unnamed protein product [Allacma fusca]
MNGITLALDGNRISDELQSGHRLAKPELCNPLIFSWLLKCWEIKPEDRPTFAEAKDFFRSQIAQNWKNEYENVL